MTEDNLPKVFGQDKLKTLAQDGRPCEICSEHMHEHEWAVLDVNGFAIFCSNLTFEYRGFLELHAQYEDSDGIFAPDTQTYRGTNVNSIDDIREQTIKKVTENFESDKTCIRAELKSRRIYEFEGNKKVILELERS